MSYAGYRIIINNITVPNSMIQKGTWVFNPKDRIVATWKDGNQTEHRRILPNAKTEISFSIKVRTEEEQATINSIFAQKENIPVTFYNDFTGDYDTGLFFMDTPQISHKDTIDGIRYNATPVHLTQY